MRMVTYIRGTGKMTKRMGRECTQTRVVRPILESGAKISSTVLAFKNGRTAQATKGKSLSYTGSTMRGISMEEGSSAVQTGQFTKVTLIKM